MDRITLKYKQKPEKYDVVVIGGGTAGSIAAAAAARAGKKTLICEREYALGGTVTMAITLPRMRNALPREVFNSGLAAELQTAMRDEKHAYADTWFDPQLMKVALERLCLKYGAEILYGACFVDVVKDGGRITGALFMTCDGLRLICADSFIDATGGGAVAVAAGHEYESGDENGENQPMTLRFAVRNVDFTRLSAFLRSIGLYAPENAPVFEMASVWTRQSALRELFEKAVNDGVLKKRDGNYFQAFNCINCGDGILWCNCPEAGHIRDANSPESVTQMVLYSREATLRLIDFMKKYLDGFDGAELDMFSEIPGIRESRRIIGEYYMTDEDFFARKKSPDGIAQTAYPIDIHSEKALRFENTKGGFYEIPFGALVPKGSENLLVAGRCISSSFVAQSSLRIQLVCMATGEAAGIAAAMGGNVKKITGREVRSEMIRFGGEFIDC